MTEALAVIFGRPLVGEDGVFVRVSLSGQQYVGPYRLLTLVNRGQTSQVWAAIKDTSQERLALKILLPDFRRNREHVAYMKNEYAVGRGLVHERVIRILDHGVTRRIPYLALEFFPSRNMKDMILYVRDRIAFMLPMIIERAAEGLAYFNEQGWIHRDVKPDNFLVNEEGEVKLIDFALSVRRKAGLSKLLARKTKVQGTRSYMSPEQIRGQPLDLTSDVYSFACTTFHLLAAQLPFTGTTSTELLNKHLRSAAPFIEAYNRNVTPQFSELLHRMMSKRPQARPQSMSEFLRDYRAIQVYKQPPPRPVVSGGQETVA